MAADVAMDETAGVDVSEAQGHLPRPEGVHERPGTAAEGPGESKHDVKKGSLAKLILRGWKGDPRRGGDGEAGERPSEGMPSARSRSGLVTAVTFSRK